MHRKATVRRTGFTFVELMIVLGIIMVIALMSYPSLQRAIYRARLEGGARQIASLMQLARYNAIRHGAFATVRADFGGQNIQAFRDLDADGTLDAGEAMISGDQGYALPKGVSFQGPAGDPDGAVKGFAEDASGGWVIFRSDGSVEEAGSLRLTDVRGNTLEVQVQPRSTARIEVRKWDGSAFRSQGEGNKAWRFD